MNNIKPAAGQWWNCQLSTDGKAEKQLCEVFISWIGEKTVTIEYDERAEITLPLEEKYIEFIEYIRTAPPTDEIWVG